jgi:hypothetical protein
MGGVSVRKKTKFILKHYETDQIHNKEFTNIDKAFEAKDKLNNKTGLEWNVVAQTPFGNTIVFSDEKWKWRG